PPPGAAAGRTGAAEATEPPAAGRVVGLVLELEVELLAERVERGETVDHVRPGGLLAEGRSFLVELVLDLADELLEDVLEGDDPRRAAELVEDDGRLDALAADLREGPAKRQRLRHDPHLPHEVAGPAVR